MKADGGLVTELVLSAHDVAVALDIEVDLNAPVPEGLLIEARPRIEGYVAQRLIFRVGETACPGSVESVSSEGGESVTVVLRHECPDAGERVSLDYHLFFDIDPAHRALGRVGQDGEVLFDRAATSASLSKGDLVVQGPLERLQRIFLLGVEHILIGYDHIFFLVALILFANRFWPVVGIVTGFTIAHSITLALAWFGVVTPPAALVEIAIALSIAVVAAENLLKVRIGPRWIVASAFGLVHGLGFYGVLSDLELGGDVVLTLLGFNLGVEVGQLAIVAIAFLFLAGFRRRPDYELMARAASGGMLAVALWLAVDRIGWV